MQAREISVLCNFLSLQATLLKVKVARAIIHTEATSSYTSYTLYYAPGSLQMDYTC